MVFIFVRADCPIPNRYAPELQHLHETFSPQGVIFYAVYPDPAATATQIKEHLLAFALPMEALRDPHHDLAALANATITPEAAIFIASGSMSPRRVYHGRIDNRYVDFRRARPAATHRELNDTLLAIIAEHPITIDHAPAVGCYLEDLK